MSSFKLIRTKSKLKTGRHYKIKQKGGIIIRALCICSAGNISLIKIKEQKTFNEMFNLKVI